MRASSVGLLRARHLQCIVAGRTLWHDLDVSVAPGERWAIRGPSGSGKTLLLRTLAGLEPCNGELLLDGKAFVAWWPPAWRSQVAYLSQRATLPEGTVEAAFKAPFAYRVHRGKTLDQAWLQHSLDALELTPVFLSQQTSGLSGGEAQLVALLRTLLLGPRILLLDEATASIDPARTARVERLLDDWLQEKPDRACMWTSHDEAQLARVSTRSLVLGEYA